MSGSLKRHWLWFVFVRVLLYAAAAATVYGLISFWYHYMICEIYTPARLRVRARRRWKHDISNATLKDNFAKLVMIFCTAKKQQIFLFTKMGHNWVKARLAEISFFGEMAPIYYLVGCRQKIKKIPPALFGTGLTQKTIWRQFFWRRVPSSLTTRAF